MILIVLGGQISTSSFCIVWKTLTIFCFWLFFVIFGVFCIYSDFFGSFFFVAYKKHILL